MFNNISIFTILLFILTSICFLSYTVYKIIKRKYFLSIFNINLYIFAFSLLITSWFQFTEEAWGYLGVNSPSEYYKYLDKIIFINCIGFLIYLIVAFIIEFNFYEIRKVNLEEKYIRFARVIDDKNIFIIFWICAVAWIGLIIIGGGIPLFGNRMMFNSSELRILRPIYLMLNYIISILSTYFSFKYIMTNSKKILLNFILGLIIILLTGNRGPIMFLVLNMFIIWVYFKNNVVKANKLIVLAVTITLILGVSLSFIRSGEFNINGIVEKFKSEIIYGNTFSDIRDGAYVLRGYEEKFDGYLLGKNYLADAISFIPSSMSEFRAEWAYGSFSTETLFGMKDHYGLRGGWFLEPYINFGYLGIIVIAIINGVVIALAEKMFYKHVISNKDKNFDKMQILMTFIIFIASSLMISSSFNSFYAYIAIIIMYIVINYLFRRFNKCV